jgi:hypothetical protein
LAKALDTEVRRSRPVDDDDGGDDDDGDDGGDGDDTPHQDTTGAGLGLHKSVVEETTPNISSHADDDGFCSDTKNPVHFFMASPAVAESASDSSSQASLSPLPMVFRLPLEVPSRRTKTSRSSNLALPPVASPAAPDVAAAAAAAVAKQNRLLRLSKGKEVG